MRRIFLLPMAAGLVLSACTNMRENATDIPPAPVAPQQPYVRELHGDRFVDNYFWLRERTNPAVRTYLEAENAYTATVMSHTKNLQEKLYGEIVSRIQETDFSASASKGAWGYYYRTERGKQYRIYCRKPANLPAPEQVILDLNLLAKGEKFSSVGGLEVSDDANLLAYTMDNVGFRQYRLQVKDLQTGRNLPDAAERVTSLAWAADNKTVFFTTEDPVTKRSDKLFRLRLGQSPILVLEEKDERFDLAVTRFRSGLQLGLATTSHTTSEWRLLPADLPEGPWRVVADRRPDHEYYLDAHGDELYIWSNRTGRNFALFKVSLTDTAEEQWREVLPHQKDVKIEGVTCFRDYYVVEERASGLVRFQATRFKDEARHTVQFPETAYVAGAERNLEYDSKVFRYSYASPKTPNSVFEHNLENKSNTLLKQDAVLGGYDANLYEVERVWAKAKDGSSVPVTVLYHKSTRRDGSAPLLLEGYGAYGYAQDAGFDSRVFSLVDRGIVFALAHVRGGGDMGKPWHDGGRMGNKMNTFTDFIACAEYLIELKFTQPNRLVISGGSAGGLLMGAVTNLRPDLFKAVVSYVPFVDVINTMSDESLPLTVSEFEEWGNPKVAEQYGWMRRYCPYTNLESKAYPAILVRTSFQDSQVMYWEPAKYVARLRTLKTDTNPLLLQVNMAGGHGGSSGRYDRFRETAFDYAFILEQVRLSEGN
jgi:oligopeptidase B